MNNQLHAVSDWLGSGSINVFGRPFAGKDTQGRILADLLGGVLVGGGDILRSHKDPEKIEAIMASGGIIPSDFYLDMVLPYLSQKDFDNKPLVLSAVGRSDGEQEVILKATNDSGHKTKAVILLDLSEQEIWRRFDNSKSQHDRGNRSDDKSEVLSNRLKKFQQKTQPVINFYKNAGLLIEVDGSLPRGEVTNQIITALYNRAKND